MGPDDVVVNETLENGSRASRLIRTADIVGELHHGGRPAPGDVVWMRGADGRLWQVHAGSPAHEHLVDRGAVQVEEPPVEEVG